MYVDSCMIWSKPNAPYHPYDADWQKSHVLEDLNYYYSHWSEDSPQYYFDPEYHRYLKRSDRDLEGLVSNQKSRNVHDCTKKQSRVTIFAK